MAYEQRGSYWFNPDTQMWTARDPTDSRMMEDPNWAPSLNFEEARRILQAEPTEAGFQKAVTASGTGPFELSQWLQNQGLMTPEIQQASQGLTNVALQSAADRNFNVGGVDLGPLLIAGGMGAAGLLGGAAGGAALSPIEAGVGTSVADLAGAAEAAGAAAGGGYDLATGAEIFTPGSVGGGYGGALPELAAAGAAMPAAIPEADPTFGGALSETSPGVFENVGNTAAFGEVGAGAGAAAGVGGAQALSGGSGGGASSGGGGGSAGGGGSLMDSWLTDDDTWQQMLLRGAPGLIGALGAASQAEDMEDLAHQYSQMGAPYRDRLAQLYANPQAFLSSPEVTGPIQQGTDMLARSLSVKGNPAGSGNALQELQNYTSTQLFNRLGQEKDRLGGFGGLTAYNQAAPQAAQGVIGAQGDIYSSLGGAAADIFNPRRRVTLQDLIGGY